MNVFYLVHHTITLFFLRTSSPLSFLLHKGLPCLILLSCFVYIFILYHTRVSARMTPGCQTSQHPGVVQHETRVSYISSSQQS